MIDFRVESNGYGPLPAGLDVKAPDGYVTIVGENDIGKTALLQYIFCRLYDKGMASEICFIPKYRDFLSKSTETGGADLAQLNSQIKNKFELQKLLHEAYDNWYQRMFSILINESSLGNQINKITEILEEFGFGDYENGKGGASFINGIAAPEHGSGLRSFLPIAAALTCSSIKYILIDEPEGGLEAGKQKHLKKLFQKYAKETGKNIIITTHSHLFLNEDPSENNLKIAREANGVSLAPVFGTGDLSNIAFKMLGSSLSDLYLPDNFLLVEGASDQILCEKVTALLKEESGSDFNLRIISCGGVQDVEPTQRSMEHVFTPIVEGKSPYAKIAVALIDRPEGKDLEDIAKELRKTLDSDGRYFELSEVSLEQYIPEDIYTRAGMVKIDEVDKMNASKNWEEKRGIKKHISKKISAVLTNTDLDKIPKIKAAVLKSIGK